MINKDQLVSINMTPSFLEYLDKLRMINPTETDQHILAYLFMQGLYDLLKKNDKLSLESILDLTKIDVRISTDN